MTPKEVVLNHLAMANKMAARYAERLPVDRNDVLSAAYYGLVKAARRENPKNSYVASCIRGEIMNTMRDFSSISARDQDFLTRYKAQEGSMADKAKAMNLPVTYVFRRLAKMQFVVPLTEDIPARKESQLNDILEVCLSYLPKKFHRVFLLRYRDGLKLGEIATVTGFTMKTVYSMTRRAIKLLRDNKSELSELLY